MRSAPRALTAPPLLPSSPPPDFNLSKLLEGARPESSLTSTGGVTNPMWLVRSLLGRGNRWRQRPAQQASLLHGAKSSAHAIITGGPLAALLPIMGQAPEVMADERPTDASDVFSFGMVRPWLAHVPLAVHLNAHEARS